MKNTTRTIVVGTNTSSFKIPVHNTVNEVINQAAPTVINIVKLKSFNNGGSVPRRGKFKRK
jgi:hypothetical protein